MNQSNTEKFVYTAHRFLLSLIFLVAGSGHIMNTDKIVMRMSKLSVVPYLEMIAPLSVHAVLSGIVLILGGLGLLLGFKTRLSSILLILVLIPITLSVQLEGKESIGPLFKNIGLLGGLLYFSYFGAKGWSLDNRISRVSGLFVVLLFTSVMLPLRVEANPVVVVDKIVVLVKKEQHLKVTIKTLVEGKSAVDGLKINRSTIIVCGKEAALVLKKDTSLKEEMKLVQENGIDLVACGISLKQAKVDAKELLPFIRVVPNGLREIIKLKALGYMGIDL